MLDRKIDGFPRFISHRWHHPAGRPVRVFSVGVLFTATDTATPGDYNHHPTGIRTSSNRQNGRQSASAMTIKTIISLAVYFNRFLTSTVDQ